MFKNNQIHKDMKPDNVLLKRSVEDPNLAEVKICDFGFADTYMKFGSHNFDDKLPEQENYNFEIES